MPVAGVIAEFNPLHNGHAHLLSQAKQFAGDGVVVVMSGNFTQRADLALLSSRWRTKMALSSGADLVLELPLPFAVGSAGFFARGGVETLASLGLVDTLVFGSECGDTDLLLQTADALLSSETERTIQAFMKQGLSFPSARERAVRACFSDAIADVLKAPNNVLGVEYILASKKLGAPLAFYSVPRVGTAHDAQTPQDDFASASFLRTQIKKGFSVDRYVPASALSLLREATEKGECPADFQKLETAVLAFLRKASPADFAGVPDVSEGIENRILDAVRAADSLQAVFDNAKTKRYTHARIRRIVLCAFLGVTKKMQEEGVPYLRVLGANERGLKLLKRAEETAKKPILLRASDARSLSEAGQAVFNLTCKATDLYNLALPETRPCGTEMTDPICFP